MILAADQARLLAVTGDVMLDVDEPLDDEPSVFDEEFDDDSDLFAAPGPAVRGPLTAAQRAAVSERMRRYWAARQGGATRRRA